MMVWEVAEDITEEEWHRLWTKFNGKQGRRRAAEHRLKDLSLLQLYRYRKSWKSVLEVIDKNRIQLFPGKADYLCRRGNQAVEDMSSVFRRIL